MPLPPPVTMARRFLMPRSMQLSSSKYLTPTRVVAGQQRVEDARERAFVPATSIMLALYLKVRGRRDKPGDDAGVDSEVIEIRSNRRHSGAEYEETHVGIFGRQGQHHAHRGNLPAGLPPGRYFSRIRLRDRRLTRPLDGAASLRRRERPHQAQRTQLAVADRG